MRKFKISLILLSVFSLLTSCTTTEDSNDISTPPAGTDLYKKVIFQTQSANASVNTKEIQHFVNNEVVADTVFDSTNQWTHRKLVFFNGTTKVFQTLDNTGQITAHREETYDNQGRVTGRRTYVPSNNIIAVTYTYNTDNTVTCNAVNLVDQTVTQVATYHKNGNGLIYKKFEQQSPPFGTAMVESTVQFNNSQPVSLSNSLNSSVISFNYYSNPKPYALMKSTDELNNSVLLGLSLTKLAEDGNFYYKRLDGGNSTYQTDFNANNYIEYYKLAYSSNGNISATEIFYYYN